MQRSSLCVSRRTPTHPMLNKDFKEFIQLLNSSSTEFLIVGGYALAAHGHPRYTGDIDIWIGRTDKNIALVLEALREFGFGELGISAADLSAPNSVVQLGYPPARIDLLSSIDGVDFTTCYAKRVVMRIDDIELPIICEADFRANKFATGRLKDLADVEALDQGKENMGDHRVK